MTRLDPEVRQALRQCARNQPLARRMSLFLLHIGGSLTLFAAMLLILTRLMFGPGWQAVPLSSPSDWLGFFVIVLFSLSAGFALASIGVAWLCRTFRVLPESALEYLLRKGPF